MALIYYADDEKEVRDIVTVFLRSDGNDVEAFPTGDLLLAAFLRAPCDLVLLDIMMPGTDGIGILTKLREISKVPVILLTARDTDSDCYTGITLGSDDYITKPFKPMLLSAKIHALLRRVQLENDGITRSDENDLSCGNLRYECRQHACTVNGTILTLTPTELRYLSFLMSHFDEAVSRDELLNKIWGMNCEIETRVADETNRRLRKKLTAAGANVYVQTVWGYGFKLTEKDGAV